MLPIPKHLSDLLKCSNVKFERNSANFTIKAHSETVDDNFEVVTQVELIALRLTFLQSSGLLSNGVGLQWSCPHVIPTGVRLSTALHRLIKASRVV